MAREIKFRAWSKSKSVMLSSGFAVKCDGATLILEVGPKHNDWVFDDYKDFIIMQYTGLKDKNGKEIYDSDILKEGNCIGAVELDNEIGAFSWYYGTEWGKIDSEVVEVIGNIHQNSDLLK